MPLEQFVDGIIDQSSQYVGAIGMSIAHLLGEQTSNPFCPDVALPPMDTRYIECSDGSVIVKGIRLPANVVIQLRTLGLPLDAYSPGELEEAIEAVEDAGVLIEDDEGVTFEDRLHLTEFEKHERAERKEIRHHSLDIQECAPQDLFTEVKSPTFDDNEHCPHLPLSYLTEQPDENLSVSSN